MKIKAAWIPWLHEYRRRELLLAFSKCPHKLFRMGLELGAGDGFQSTLLTKYVSRIISTDSHPRILNQEGNGEVQYCLCDAEEVGSSFSEQQFDLIFSSNLLEHLYDINRSLKGIHKILIDDGIAIHVMPSPFWKFLQLVLHIPNIFASSLEILTESHGFRKIQGKVISSLYELESNQDLQSAKDFRRISPLEALQLYRLFIPYPHGVSKSNMAEFYAFSKFKWKKEFEKADFQLVKIIKGPLASAYGLGLDRLRYPLERIGITSEYIYITVKKGKDSPFIKYF